MYCCDWRGDETICPPPKCPDRFWSQHSALALLSLGDADSQLLPSVAMSGAIPACMACTGHIYSYFDVIITGWLRETMRTVIPAGSSVAVP